jgi:Arc/MetJ-type ribon-helix-helix transcriptional regulator
VLLWGKRWFMKKRISATIDSSTEKEIEKILKEGKFRNKSHVIEEAIKFFSEGRNEKK